MQSFVDDILHHRIFDNEELALMEELSPLLRKLAQGRKISGLDAYEY